MRFLVVTKIQHPTPPDPELTGAMIDWIDQHLQSGQMEQAWNFAGIAGGGGIVSVDSLEALDEVMTGFPFGPFSKVEIYPLTDLHASLQRVKALLEQHH